MKVSLDKSFPMPAAADVAWGLLQNIEEVAGCLPGAKITERVDERYFKGTLAVKLGPANMNFRGEIEVALLDAASKTLRLVGKGTDATGASGASMDLTARVEAQDEHSCRIAGTSEVSVSGKAAAFGNRLMGSVADQVLKQFATRLADKLAVLQGKAEAKAAKEAQAAAERAAREQAAASATAPAPVAAAPVAAPEPVTEPAPAATPAAPEQLNALSLLWGLLRDWFAGLFGRRK